MYMYILAFSCSGYTLIYLPVAPPPFLVSYPPMFCKLWHRHFGKYSHLTFKHRKVAIHDSVFRSHKSLLRVGSCDLH